MMTQRKIPGPDGLIDVHTHVGLDAGFLLRGWWPYAATGQQLLDEMDRNDIQYACCWSFTLPTAFDPLKFAKQDRVELLEDRFPFDFEAELLLKEVERLGASDRLFVFAMFDPGREVDRQLDNLQRLGGRIAGLKSQTTILQSSVRRLCDEAAPLMHFAADNNLPVVLHTSVNDAWAQVSDCLDVAAAHPKVRFNLAHSLRFDLPSLERARQMSNVWVDCSAHIIHCELARKNSGAVAEASRRVKTDYADPVKVMADIEAILPGRYLWGSDNPYMSWRDDKLILASSYSQEAKVLHALPPAVRDRMGRTAPRNWLLGEGHAG
jgi:predicted TIM-barrel fold metal-dependent hydrolase